MKNDDYDEDPEMGDENDPEYKEELFRGYKFMAWTPTDLADPVDRQEYADWLEKHSADEE